MTNDIVFVDTRMHYKKYKIGDIAIFQNPETAKRILIKRVEKITPDNKVITTGDNAAHSMDSRSFG